MHFQCPRPKLTQLQARCAFSLSASIFILAAYFFLTSPRLAYAQELSHPDAINSESGDDHNWYREWDIIQEAVFGQRFDDDTAREIFSGETARAQQDLDPIDATPTSTKTYEKRQATATNTLPGNNTPAMQTIAGSTTQQWVFPSADVFGPPGEYGKGLPSSLVVFEDVLPGETGYYDTYYGTGGFSKREEANLTVYVSMNVCTQPTWSGTGEQVEYPPQLTLYASSTTTQIGPDYPENDDNPDVFAWDLDEGYVAGYLNSTGDVYFVVASNATPSGFTGDWSYSIAASIDLWFHTSDVGMPPLFLVDTDTDSALLVTNNVTLANSSDPVYTEWMDLDPVPFVIFAQNTANINRLVGLRQSYCALQTLADIAADVKDATNPDSPVQMEMTTRGLGEKPKEQFYMRGLNGSSSYSVWLAMDGNSTDSGAGVIGGGGTVWSVTNLTTKSYGNCALLFGLDFCDTVAYAVPSNPHTYPNITALGDFYDSYASLLYTNFSLSLQLIACNATSTSRYSLSKDCDDCAAAYKAWICAVTIPRCMDYNTPLSYLQPRNVAQDFFNNASMLPDSVLQGLYNPMPGAPYGSIADQQRLVNTMAANSSRNPRIDSMVQPGPYAELLPCEDTCWNLVRSCPAALGFVCPFPGRGLEVGYGQRIAGDALSCNYAGATYQLGGAGRVASPGCLMVVGTLAVILVGW